MPVGAVTGFTTTVADVGPVAVLQVRVNDAGVAVSKLVALSAPEPAVSATSAARRFVACLLNTELLMGLAIPFSFSFSEQEPDTASKSVAVWLIGQQEKEL